ncbi:error-prone DNA polymerase [Microbacterium sp. APC 3901]|uniref:error-prone DNA polymerase n=1 Tax=Microbacterium sp. APC 3901 TaxID=3035192 RepID=UPI0025B5A49F|nr:error-prone DNA polymerase [Microbacterium sp. APC 3901]MDN3444925.1 error-prone DNA polymerase [Microbacterium sp. APC 3901]
MGWHNPPLSWNELERTLSGEESPYPTGGMPPGSRPDPGPVSTKRKRNPPTSVHRPEDAVPYAELHAHSSYSFLDGASSPEDLLAEAERLGLTALALTDHDGFYGAARFAEVAELMDVSVQTVYGAELSLGLDAPQRGTPDPVGDHLLVLADGLEGYHRLSGAMTAAHLRGGEKGRPVYDLDELAATADGHWTILTGCRKGGVRRGLEAGDAQTPLRRLVDLFGQDHVAVELFDHGDPQDTRRNDALADLARRMRLPVVATNNVHYAAPERASLAEAVAAVRAVRSMDELDGWLPTHGGAHLRSGAEMSARFRRHPGAISYGLELAAASAFSLRRARPALPKQEVPDGHTPMSWLRHLVWEAVPTKYPHLDADGHRRIGRELDVIEEKDFPGYFLIVHGIVTEARRRGILCQGRGSAAASAVCYLLGITAVDPILYRLPFERFLATTRQEEPDIDVDFDSDRREEIIQWVYREYGRERAAQVANVIQYRPKNAVRDMARALGFSPGQQDAWSRQVDGWSTGLEVADEHDIPANVLEYAGELLKAPRHLGIHSGGMVLTARPVGEVVPVEHARMENRTVIQWDKDDAAWMGLVKFDLLGLGMLAALQHCFDLIDDATGERWTLETLPKEEPAVYDMLCRADSIGVFQVESRAQIGLLPRLQPRAFYDLAIQIALIRPGPIQGGAVHPFVRRKMAKDALDEENRARAARGEEPVVLDIPYPHDDLRPILERTLGIPIFQEQLIQMATAIGDCTADEADLLRRAMGSKRGLEKIEKVRDKLYAGMSRRGLSAEQSDRIYAQIQAFSNFGFAESHSLSFALLVYASSWLKLHYPAAFLAGLLRSQPMGFYSASTLTADARRHGVEVRRPDLHASGVTETLEPLEGAPLRMPTGLDACGDPLQPRVPRFDRSQPDESAAHRRDGAYAVRMGLSGVRGIGTPLAERIVAEREAAGPFRDLNDLVRRTDATAAQLESLATAGAFECLGLQRREAIWLSGAAAEGRSRFLPGTAIAVQPPLFSDQSSYERLSADLWATGVSTDDHPMAHFRGLLRERGVLTSSDLQSHETGRRIEVAGLVTHRQRPATAAGVTFLNLEDENGLVNVICSTGVWGRYHRVARDSPALIIRGILERSAEGVVNVLADAFEDLRTGVTHRSRDFR